MKERLSPQRRLRIMNAVRRNVGRRNHAEQRLRERFGVEYVKVKNVINNGGAKILLACRGHKKSSSRSALLYLGRASMCTQNNCRLSQ